MASIYIHSLLIFLQITTLSFATPIFLPLSKDPNTNQHITQLFTTHQLTPIPLVLDLNSPVLWLGVQTSEHSPIPRRSIQCSAAALDQAGSSDEGCRILLKNPVTGETATGELVEGVMGVGGKISADDERERELLLYGSGSSSLITGLSSGARGVLGLGRSRVGVVEQVSHKFGLSKKFSLCLSSTSDNNGMILFGENDHQSKLFKSMVYTPILMGNGDSYTINLKSLKIKNKKVALEGLSTMQISTVNPYSLMGSSAYGVFVKAFDVAAEVSGLKRVSPVGQFEVCYGARGFENVPVVDLVLQSEMVKWRIYGHNSMVKVSEEVMCLGVLDGGVDLGSSVVLGSHQLEDNLLEFDLGSSMLGFSSSLAMKQTSCSQLSLSAMHKDVQSF